MVVPNCCNTPAWCHNAGGPKSRDTGTARLWSQKSWWCGCLRPPIIVTVNSLLLGEWLNAFHSKVGYEWHHFLGWTFVNVKCWWVNYFIFLVSLWLHSPDSGWPPMVPDPGRSERRRSGHRPLQAVLQCFSLPSLQSQSVLTESPRVLSAAFLWEGLDSAQRTDSLITILVSAGFFTEDTEAWGEAKT